MRKLWVCKIHDNGDALHLSTTCPMPHSSPICRLVGTARRIIRPSSLLVKCSRVLPNPSRCSSHHFRWCFFAVNNPSIHIWLVVWSRFYFSIYWDMLGRIIMPTDELIFFRGVGLPPTSSGPFGFCSMFVSHDCHMWHHGHAIDRFRRSHWRSRWTVAQ